MKPNDQQFCAAHIRDLFGRFSHTWGRSKGRSRPIRTGDSCLILAALVFLASGFLFGCSGGYHAAATPPTAPPTLPSAGSLSSSCTAAATIGAYNCQITVSSGKAPFTWTANTLPRGLRLAVSADTTTATISGTVQGQQAITTTSLTALVTPAKATTTTVSVQLTVADSASRSASLTFSITLTISPLAITTTSPLPAATLGSAYSVMVTAAGGLQPYTWTVATGSSLPAGLTLTSGSPSATISGTPTATGTFTFTLNVTDSDTPTPTTTSASFTLTVSTSSTLNCPAIPVPPAPPIFTMCGTNWFGVGGFVGTTGPAAIGGSFIADNSGHIVSGVMDLNSVSGGQANVTITGGSYSVGADGRGVLTLIDSNGVSRTFRFALESTANAGTAAIEEFDTSGTLAAGPMFGIGTLPLATISPGTILAFRLEGYDLPGKRSGMLGEFQVGGTGCDGSANSLNSVTGEPVVSNTAGAVNTGLTITGSCTAPDPKTGRGTARITISGGTPFANNILNFVYYAVGASGTGLLGVFLGESDAIALNQPILNGLAQALSVPINPPLNACVAPGACILAGVGTTDGTINGHGVGLLVRAVATGTATSGTIVGVLDENSGGIITTAGVWPYTAYTIDANGVGTITGSGSTIHIVADGTFIDESVSVITGDGTIQNTKLIESPGAPYIIGEAIGTSGVGATPLAPHVAGVVTPAGTTTTGNFANPGTVVDVSSLGGLLPDASGSGTYTINSTSGRGTGTANFTGGTSSIAVVFYAGRHRRFSVLDVQSTDPVLLGARLQ
jgi:Putative Ig domain